MEKKSPKLTTSEALECYKNLIANRPFREKMNLKQIPQKYMCVITKIIGCTPPTIYR